MANLTPVGVTAVVENLNGFMSGLDKMQGGITDVGGQFANLGLKLAGGAIAGGLAAVAGGFAAIAGASKLGLDSVTDWGEQLDKFSDMFGTTGEDASKWTVAMNRVGLTVDEGGQGLNYFTKNLDNVKSEMVNFVPAKTTEQIEKLKQQIDDETEALSRAQIKMATAKTPTQEMGWAIEDHQKKLARLNDAYAEATALVPATAEKLSPFQLALDKLGISAFDSTGAVRSLDSLMPEIMNKFQAMPAGIDASALAMDLFGARGGTKFLDFLRQGSQGLSDADAMAKAFGLSMSTEGVNAIEEYGFSLNELGLGFTGIKNQIGEAVLPYAQKFVDFLIQNVPTIVDWGQKLGQWIGGALQTIMDLLSRFQTGGVSGLLQGLGLTPEAQTRVQEFINYIRNLASTIQQQLTGAFMWFQQNALPLLQQGLNWIATVGLPMVLDAIDWVKEHWDILSGAITGVLIGGGILAAISIIAGIIAALTSPIGLVIAACALLGAAWAGNWLGIRDTLTKFWNETAQPTLQKLWDWLSVNIPKAIDTLVNFWNDVLLPIFTILEAVLFDTIFPILVELIKFFVITIPGAISTLIGVWNTVLLPPIQNLVNWWRQNVTPTFEAFDRFISAVFNLTLRVLAGIWENVLLPALAKVNDWITANITPTLEALDNFITAVFNMTLRVLAGLWQNVVYPALEKVWGFIKEKLTPILQALSDMWTKTVQPAIQKVADYLKITLQPIIEKIADVVSNVLGKAMQTVDTNILTPFQKGLKGIEGFLAGVRTKLNELTTALNNAKLPSWLQTGSPTPFEMGLRGIANTLDRISGASLPAFSAALPAASPISLAGGRAALPMTAAGGGGGVTVNVQTGDINNGMDLQMLDMFIQRSVMQALG